MISSGSLDKQEPWLQYLCNVTFTHLVSFLSHLLDPVTPPKADEKARGTLVAWETVNFWLCGGGSLSFVLLCSLLSGDVLSNSLLLSHTPISDSCISPKSLRQMYINCFSPVEMTSIPCWKLMRDAKGQRDQVVIWKEMVCVSLSRMCFWIFFRPLLSQWMEWLVTPNHRLMLKMSLL